MLAFIYYLPHLENESQREWGTYKQMAASNLRFGSHATSEVGMDLANMIKQLSPSERSQAKIGVFTDPNVARLDVMKVVEESLMREGLNWVVWDRCSVEPTDKSWQVGRVYSFSLSHSVLIGPYGPRARSRPRRRSRQDYEQG